MKRWSVPYPNFEFERSRYPDLSRNSEAGPDDTSETDNIDPKKGFRI